MESRLRKKYKYKKVFYYWIDQEELLMIFSFQWSIQNVSMIEVQLKQFLHLHLACNEIK